jgi:ADP-ribosylglycohydrolase
VLAEAKRSAEVTHNHPEGIKGAQAVSAAVYLARTGATKDEVKAYVETAFCYNLDASLDSIREDYRHDVTCQGSVPQALRAFLEADDLEDAVRKAVSIGGDSDTIACIAGSVAHAFYGTVSDEIRQGVFRILDDPLKEIVHAFCKRYSVPM